MDKLLRMELLEVFPHVEADRDIHNFNDIYMTVKASPGPYGDMTPRNLAGSGRAEVTDRKIEMIKRVSKSIMECLEKYCSDQKTFDAWHKDNCIWLADELQSLCSKGIKVKPGKAQKLINMSFKHIFCFDSAEKEALNGVFQFCHVPIDKYVLSWYYREVKGLGFLPDDKLGWGHLEYDEYYHIQEDIRTYLSNPHLNHDYIDKNGKLLTPFETEFYIWNEEKLMRAANEFIRESDPQHSLKWKKSSTMRAQFQTILDLIG